MRIIFLDDIPNVAKTGDIKDVKKGYAKNHLLPKGLAILATPQELSRIEAIRRVGAERSSKILGNAEALAQLVEGTNVVVKMRSGPNGRLYGAVTSTIVAQEISSILEKEFDRRNILLDEPIHELGTFEVRVRVHPELTASINVTVESIE